MAMNAGRSDRRTDKMAISLKQYAATQQDPLRSGIVDMLWSSSRLMPLLNFIPWQGLSYPYSKRTKRPGVATRGLNSDFTLAPGNYAPDIETLAILGGKVRTDTILAEMKPNLRENEIAGTVEAAGLMFDRLMIKGDPSKTGAVNEFYGLYPRISGTQLLTQATNGSGPTNEKVSELLDAVAGPNSQKVLLMNRSTRRNLSSNVKAKAGGKGVFDVGMQLANFDGANIVSVEKDEAEAEIMAFDETCGSSNECSSVLCIRLGGSVDEKDVQGILGKNIQVTPTGNFGTYIEDVIQMVGGIGVFGAYSAARLQGVTNAAVVS
jgi:hypothetical protein